MDRMEKNALGGVGDWWSQLDPKYKTMLLGAGGAAVGGAALGGLRASRPLDTEEHEDAQKRKSEVIHQALLGALLGGGGAAAAYNVPGMFADKPEGVAARAYNWITNKPNETVNWFATHRPVASALTGAQALHQFSRVPGMSTLQRIAEHPELMANYKTPAEGAADLAKKPFEAAAGALGSMSKGRRLLEYTGIPSLFRKPGTLDTAYSAIKSEAPATPFSGLAGLGKGKWQSPRKALVNTLLTALIGGTMVSPADRIINEAYSATGGK